MIDSDYKLSRLLFPALIAVLLIFKWHDLSLPYFWDELGVYSQSVYFQYHHGVSLMPSSVPSELSRGHPLLFTAMTVTWMKLFGSGIFTTHLFCLFISISLLFVVYSKTTKYYGRAAGIISSAILCIQPLFLAQSGFVLPEIMLALFMTLALCSYYEDRYLLFALWASLAILTKESAIILPAAVLFYSFISWILTRIKPKSLNPAAIFTILIPYLFFGLFLLVQKRQNGWYFFPLHKELINSAFGTMMHQLHLYLTFILKSQGRYTLSIVLIAGFIISLLRGRITVTKTVNSFLFLLILSGAAFIGFNSLFGVYMDRYVTAALVLLAILTGVSLVSITRNKWLVGAAMITFTFISSRHFDDGWFHYDADLGYRRDVHVLQQAVDYTMARIKPGEKVYGYFPAYFAFSFPEGGYLKNSAIPIVIDRSGDHYMLVCEPGVEADLDHSKFQLTELKKFKEGEAQVTVYWVKKN